MVFSFTEIYFPHQCVKYGDGCSEPEVYAHTAGRSVVKPRVEGLLQHVEFSVLTALWLCPILYLWKSSSEDLKL